MAGRECYHCKTWIAEGDAHDCWTTTEAALTQELSDDLRKTCYFFVRPKKSFLEVSLFLGRALKVPQVRRAEPKSKTKFANIIQIRHRDEVESPVTDWMREAYELPDVPAAKPPATCAKKAKKTKKKVV